MHSHICARPRFHIIVDSHLRRNGSLIPQPKMAKQKNGSVKRAFDDFSRHRMGKRWKAGMGEHCDFTQRVAFILLGPCDEHAKLLHYDSSQSLQASLNTPLCCDTWINFPLRRMEIVYRTNWFLVQFVTRNALLKELGRSRYSENIPVRLVEATTAQERDTPPDKGQ
jgi:hypothetical protein